MGYFVPLPKELHPDFFTPKVKPIERVEVDWANPLSSGLRGAWLFRDGQDILGQRSFTQETTPYRLQGNAYLDPVGGLVVDGSNSCLELGSDPIHAGSLTVICCAKVTSSGGTYSICTADSDSAGRREWQFRKNSSNKLEFIPFVSNSNGVIAGATTLSTTEPQIYGCSHEGGGSSNNIKVYVDGKLDGTSTKAGALDADGATLTVGARARAVPISSPVQIVDDMTGNVEWLLIWDRALGEAEHRAIADNFKQIFKPAVELSFYAVSGGTGGGFQSAWALGSNQLIQGGTQ
jgi:hypothetical protein